MRGVYLKVRPLCTILRLIAVALLLTALGVSATASGQRRPANTAQHRGAMTGDLTEVLAAVATQMKTPIVAELALPLPHGFDIPEGSDTAEHLLNAIVASSLGYAWEWSGSVAHVYQRQLLRAPANFLNIQTDSLQLPNSVAELSVGLRYALQHCSKKPPAYRKCPLTFSFVIRGIWPTELDSLRLKPRKMSVMSARQVLLEAANNNGQFYSMVVFPRAYPTTPKDGEFGFNHWVWHPLSNTDKPFPLPFSWYGRTFRVQPDVLLQYLITTVPVSKEPPNARLSITVDEQGRVQHVSVVEGRMSDAAIRVVRAWRFHPYHLNGLPPTLVCELPVEVRRDGAVRPVLSQRGNL